VDNSGDNFVLASPSNTDVEMTNQTGQGHNDGNDGDEGDEEGGGEYYLFAFKLYLIESFHI
jgi:hypothetical protein